MKAERARLKAVRNEFRQWLKVNAPKARITSEMDIAVHAVGVKLNGTKLATIRKAPMVRHAELQGIFRSMAHDDPDLSLIHANEAWAAVGGAANAGAGVKVAVIDSGIDVTHPCFDDAGYAAQTQLGDTSLTNNKVIVAKVFNNKAAKKRLRRRARSSARHARRRHDRVQRPHAGRRSTASTSRTTRRAWRRARCSATTTSSPVTTASARSEDILDALDAAYADGFDVANMSLGGARNDGGGAFLLDNAIDNLDRANMVVAVAAGNEGPGYFTVHYPGAAPRALTAGASTVGHRIVNLVTVDGTDYEAVVGDFAVDHDATSRRRSRSCRAASVYPHASTWPATTVRALPCRPDGQDRPARSWRLRLHGQGPQRPERRCDRRDHGQPGPGEAPFVMSHNGLEPQPTIPAVMVSLEDGAADRRPRRRRRHDPGARRVRHDARGHEPDGGLQQPGPDAR